MKKYLLLFLAGIGMATITGCDKKCQDDCLNGGTCVDGDCDCAPGFTGPNCEDAVSVKVTKVTVTSIPWTNSGGADWDDSDGPDVFPIVKDEDNVEVYDADAQTVSNAQQGDFPLVFTLPSAYQTTDLEKMLTVTVYDNDDLLDDDDPIGFVTFNVNDYISGSDSYPTTVEQTSSSLTVKLTLEWNN